MKEALMPIVYLSGAIILSGIAIIIPMIALAVYRDLFGKK